MADAHHPDTPRNRGDHDAPPMSPVTLAASAVSTAAIVGALGHSSSAPWPLGSMDAWGPWSRRSRPASA